MAGITDPAFRLLCNELGAGLCVTELTSVNSIVSKRMIEFSKKEKPRSVQLFGNNISLTVKAAKILEKDFDMIDFNMGCPSPKITQQEAGAALLQKEAHVRKLFTSLVKAVKIPITLKLRTGIDKPDKYLKIAKIAEECGISMITLHARTLKQGYSGKADWSCIKKLKESVKIPVVGNGDVETPEDAKRMIEETKCDYVMIGRAVRGNPYIFKQINDYLKTGKYKKENQIKYFKKYLKYTKDFNIKFPDIRGHAMHYTKGMEGGAELRSKMSKVKDISELKKRIQFFYKFGRNAPQTQSIC